jgi:predicted TIM-barrel fold metal-dependent hydrolase
MGSRAFCDCHVHVVGAAVRFPQLAARNYTARPAALESLRAAAEPFGVTRFVVVQPSFYGSDNSCLCDALASLGDRGRGVMVIDPKLATPGLFEAYAERGVCGVRVNLYSGLGTVGAAGAGDFLRRVTDLLPREGWHVEVIAPLPTLVPMAPILANAPVHVVIDHYGLPDGASPEGREGGCLTELAGLEHVWVKLSAPYRVLPDPLATLPPSAWLAALLRAAPDRCVWGSDWPHTPPREEQKGAGVDAAYRMLDYARAFQDFCGALPDPALAERILVDNPERLYGF